MVEKSSSSTYPDIKWIKQIGDFCISNHLLGRGEYSEVYLGCFAKDPSKKVACKIMNPIKLENDPYVLETMNRQYDLMIGIDHENVVRFYDMSKTSKHWYFFFEYCSMGTLENYLVKKKGKISEARALLIFLDIIEGYKALYKNNILHRDLKPENILMAPNGVKISDFSFAKMVRPDQINQMIEQSFVGTPVYSPLEILEGKKYSSKCDVWSLGIIFYQMLFGRFPFIWKAMLKNDLMGGIGKLINEIKKNPLDFPDSVKISKKIKNLLEKLLEKEESKRISWEEVFKESSKIDFNDLCEFPPELKGFDMMKQQEIMEKSGLNKGFNMGKSTVATSLLHTTLKSQNFVNENFIEKDLDEDVGDVGVKIRETKSVKSLTGSKNNINF